MAPTVRRKLLGLSFRICPPISLAFCAWSACVCHDEPPFFEAAPINFDPVVFFMTAPIYLQICGRFSKIPPSIPHVVASG